MYNGFLNFRAYLLTYLISSVPLLISVHVDIRPWHGAGAEH